jgi:hypothetical protein
MAGKLIDEVRVAIDGVVAVGDFGAAAPTSAISSLTGTHTDYGYVSEDGVTESTSTTSEKIRAWQKAKVVRTTVTEGTTSYNMVLIQTSAATVAMYYNGTLDADGSIVADPTKDRPLLSLVIDVIDGDEVIRSYAPEAQIMEVGDQVYQNGAAIGYEVTIEAAYNEALGGSVKKWYSTLASPVAPTVTGATPTGAAEGAQVKIVGTSFVGVSGVASVKFGSTNATSYMVDDNSTIYAIMPAGTAGSANITVTNATGTSSAFSYTRGA